MLLKEYRICMPLSVEEVSNALCECEYEYNLIEFNAFHYSTE